MNAIYKIKYSRSRGQYVVVHEYAKSHQKGRLSAAVVTALLSGAMSGVPAVYASSITPETGWKHTTVTQTVSGRFDITTSKTQVHEATSSTIGINRFEKFELSQNHIANLHQAAGSSTLVNFVNQKITVDGTVNSVVNKTDIGGELVFISPQGMVVGTTGVINAGSLTVAAPTEDKFKDWKGKADDAHEKSSLPLEAIRRGEIPMNRNAVITIDGSINAGNQVTLAATSIEVGTKGSIRTDVTDFSNLVNIGTDPTVLASGVTTAQLTGKLDASGDIILSSIADTAGVSPDTGVTIIHESTAAKVDVKGNLESRKDVKVKALAGNGTYREIKPVGWTEQDGYFEPNGDNHVTTVKATVDVTGSIVAANHLTIDAQAENRLDDSGIGNLAKDLSFEILGDTTPFNFDFGFGNLTTQATVTVGNNATLSAGKDLTVEALADTRMTIGAKTSFAKALDLLENQGTKQIPAAAALVGIIDNDASVSVNGTMKAGQAAGATDAQLTVGAKSYLEATLSASSGTVGDDSFLATVSVGIFDSHAKTTITPDAIVINDTAVNFYADQTSAIETAALTSVQNGSTGGVSFNYTEHNSGADLIFTGDIAKGASSVTMAAKNVTQAQKVIAEVGIAPFDFLANLYTYIVKVPVNFVAGLMGKAAQGIDTKATEENFRLGGAVAVVVGQQTASLSVSTGQQGIKAAGDINLQSTSSLWDHHYKVSSRVNSKANSGSLAVLVTTPGVKVEGPTVLSALTIADNAIIESADGNVIILNEARIEWNRVNAMKNDLNQFWTDFKDYFTSKGWDNVDTAFSEVNGAFDKISDTETFFDGLAQFGSAMGTIVTGVSEVFGNLVGIGTNAAGIVTTLLDFASPISYMNAYVGSGGAGDEGAKLAAAGSIAVVMQETKATTTVGKNALIRALGQDTPADTSNKTPAILRGRVTITGRSENDSLLLGGHLNNIAGFTIPNIQGEKVNAVGAAVILNFVTTDNVVRIREGATITADNAVAVKAIDDMNIITIGAASDITSGSLGVDVLAASTVTDASNILEVDDEVNFTTAVLGLEALRDDNIQTIAGSVLIEINEDGATGAGMAIGMNFGSIANKIEVKDNDALTDGEASVVNTPGKWIATDSIETVSRAHVATNAIGVAGSVAIAGKSDDTEPGAIDKLKAFFGKVSSKVFGGLNKLVDKVGGGLNNIMYTGGDKIHKHFTKNQNQNANDSGVLNNEPDTANEAPAAPNANDVSQLGEESATTTDAGSTNAAQTEAGKKFSISLAGSAAWTKLDLTTTVSMNADGLTVQTPTANFDAISDKWMGSWAGSAAINAVLGTQSGQARMTTVGVSGAVAGNSSHSTAGVYINAINATNDKRIRFENPAIEQGTDLRVYSINDGTIVSEGLVATVGAGEGSSYAFEASVSANLYKSTTDAKVSGITVADSNSPEDDEDSEVDIAAYVGEWQTTGGTAFGLTLGGNQGNNASVGMIFAVADIENTASAELKNAEIHANKIDVRALSGLDQVTTAVNAQIAAGGRSSFGFTGTAGTAALTNTVTTTVDNALVTLKGAKAYFDVASRVATDEEVTAFEGLANHEFAFDKKLVYQDENNQTVSARDNANLFKDVSLYTDKEQSQENAKDIDDFVVGKNMLQTTVVFSLGVSTNGSAAGASVLVNQIDNAFTSATDGLTVNTDSNATDAAYAQVAYSDVTSLAVVVGATGASGLFSAAGSVIVSDIDQHAESIATNLTTHTHQSGLTANNEALSINVAGNVGVSTGSGQSNHGGAVGGAVIVSNIHNDARVEGDALSILHADLFEAKAMNTAQSWGASVAATVTKNLGFGGSVLVNRAKNATIVSLDSLTLTEVKTAQVQAKDETELWNLAGGVTVAYDSSGIAGVGGAVVYAGSLNETDDEEKNGTQVKVNDLTVNTISDQKTDFSAHAIANDTIRTLVLSAGVTTGYVGFGGSAATNDIRRIVASNVSNITTQAIVSGNTIAHESLGTLSVQAIENASIGNIVIAAGAAGSSGAGIGIGVAVNRIDNATQAKLSDTRTTPVVFDTDLLKIKAHTNNDIDTIGVGGAGSGTAAIAGSVAVNLVDADTTAEINKAKVNVMAAAVEAQSDDTIGTYSGQGSGGTVAVGVSVTVSERVGETAVKLTDASITEKTGGEIAEVKGAVSDSDVSGLGDFSTSATLAEKRAEDTVKGVAVRATSTETFKTLVINAAGGQVAVNGTTNVIYTDGQTRLDISGVTINTKEGFDSLTADYTNISTSMSTASGGEVAVAAGVNVTTTEHLTETKMTGANTLTGNVNMHTEAVESIANVLVTAAGSMYASVAPMVSVNRLLSDVKSNVSGVTGTGAKYAQTADYLGVTHNVGVGVAGAAYASVGAAVQINYFDNDVLTALSNSNLTYSTAQNIEALRRTDLSLTDVLVSGSIAGVATSVNVNTVEGASETTVSDSKLNDGDITIEAEGKDNLKNVNVLVAGGVGAVGATVIVNNVYADAKTAIHRSTMDTVKTLTVKTHQNRLMDQTLANVTGGVGALQANVIVNNIGSGADLFATTQTGLQDTETTVNTYLDSYAGTSSASAPGLLGSLVNDTHGALTEEETQGAFKAAASTAELTKTAAGTRTVVTGSVINANTLSITAEEDTGSDQKMHVDVGSGSGGVGALAASVATLRYTHAAAVDLASSQITSTQSALIGSLIGGQTYMRTVQATVALGTGFAAYVDAEITGGGAVNIMDTDITALESAKTTIQYKDTSDVHLETLGVTLAGAAGGGMVADLRDKTSSGVTVNGQTVSGAAKKTMKGNTSIQSIRAGVRRVKTMAAYGGGAVGVGSLAKVTDSGEQSISIAGTQVTGSQFEVLANNQATLITKAWGDGGAGVAIGVVQAFTTVNGKTDVTLKNNALEADNTNIWGASGRETFEDDYNPIAIIEDNDKLATHRQNSEELTLLAEGDAYSGGGVAINVNTAQVTNNTKTSVLLENNTASNEAVVSVNAVGFARSILDSDVAGGGAIYSGNTRAYVTHGAEVKASVMNTTAALHTRDLSVTSKNAEKLLATAQSYGGGVLTFEGATGNDMAAQVIHKDTSSSTVNLDGSFYAQRDLTAHAESDFDITVEADNAKGAVVGVSGSGFDNSMQGKTSVYVASNSTLDAQRNLSLDARTDINLRGKNKRAVDAQVYGAVGVATIRIDNEMARINEVEIGQSAKLSAQDALALSAFTDSDVELRVRAASAGLGAGTEARANHTITTSNLVTVGEKASIRNADGAHTVILSASSDEDLLLYSVGDVQGAAVGFSGAYADIEYTRNNKVTTKKSSTIYGAGNVKLLAGQNPQEKEANLKLDTQTESYAYSLGAPFTTLDADFVTNDQLTVAGDVKSVRSITAFADQGEVFSIVSARQYGIWDGGGEMEIATSAVGEKSSHMTENSLMTVNGTMVAGLETLFDLTISGTVDVPASEQTAGSTLHIEGSSASPTLSFGKTNVATEGKVTTTVVDQANVYYERHEELLKAMELYGKDDSNDSAYAILKAEDDFIINQMIAQGWATRDNNGNVNITNKNGEAVHNVVVKNITVSGGNIDLTTDSVTGTGVISANAAEGIKIDNQTNLGLTLENLIIWEKGGQLTLNDTAVKTLTGFSGTASSALSLSDPILSATSHFGEGRTVTLKGSSDSTSETKIIDPDNTVTLHGTIANHAGEISVKSGDDLLSFADVSAAGALHLSAKGSITQTYTSGIVNIGGSVSALWKTETDEFYNKESPTSTSNNTVHNGTGSWIAGDSIFIAGDTINVNGYIQSGYAEYGVTLDETTVTRRIGEIRSQWKRAGSKTSISPKTYILQEGGYYKKGDAYAYRTTVWYDPVRDRIVLDDITPTGGQVYLAGRITNTGGGVIKVADGHATVNVDVGNHSLLTGAISTETIKGQIQITDTGKANTPVTTITSDQSVTSYSPSAGIFYSWALGKGTTTTKKYKWQESFTLWGAIDYDEINWPEAYSTSYQELDKLAQVESVNTVTRPDNNDSHFYAWTKTVDDSGEVITYQNSWTDYGFLWFGGTHYAEKVTTQTKSTQYLYSVRGDLAIDVGFLKGNNSVTLVTGKDLYLGGNIHAAAGTVSLTAGGNILNERQDLAIIGANDVTLKATAGSIGSGSNAISLKSSTGTVKLNAQAGQSIYLDANHLGQDALLSASHIEGTKRIDVQARDNLSIDSLIGTDISLSSAEGNIKVGLLTQKTSADYSERFDAMAKSQGANITLTSVNGDLAIGEIEAADTVTINATGHLTDALDRTDEDEATADERLQKWADAGILKLDASGNVVDGTNPYTEYITNLENRVKGEFDRYQKYVEFLKSGNTKENLGALIADYKALKAKYENCADATEAVANEYANADSALAKMKAQEASYGAWTRDQLLNAINEAIVNPDASTGSKAKVSNITAKFIKVKAGSGLVGEELPSTTYKLEELQNGSDDSKALLKLLARADVDDVEIDTTKKTLTLTLKRPITISQSAGGDTSAEGQSVYLQTLENEALTVNQIAAIDTANGVVRITAGGGIAGKTNNAIHAATVTLHGGTIGGLGSLATPLNINASNWMALTSVDDIFVNGTNANGITILSLATNQTATLTSSAGIRSWAADKTGVISAQKLKLATEGFVGEADNALRIGQVGTIEFNNQLTGGLYLTIGKAGEVVLQTASQTGLTVSNDLTLTSIGSVKLQEAAKARSINLSADQGIVTKALEATNGLLTAKSTQGAVTLGDIKAQSIDVDAAGNVTVSEVTSNIKAELTSQSGSVNASAISAQSVNVNGQTDVAVTTLIADGTTALTSSNGNVSVDTYKGSDSDTTSQLNVTANAGQASVKSVTTAGGVTINAKTLADTAITKANTATITTTDNLTVGNVTTVGSMILTSNQGGVTVEKGSAAEIDIDALGGNVLVQEGLTADQGNLNVKAKGNITSGKSVIASSGNVTLDGQDIQVTGDIQGQNTSITASGNFSVANIKATTGDLTAQISGELKATTILATDELTLTANQIIVAETVTSKTTATMNANQGEVNVTTLEAPMVSVTASDNISITNLTAQTQATFESTTGDITLTQTVNPNGELIIKATQGGITSTAINATSLDATAAQAIALGSVTTDGQATLNSTASSVTASGKLDVSAVDIDAQTFVKLQEVVADTSVDVTPKTGDIIINKTISAGGDTKLSSVGQITLNEAATVGSMDADAVGNIQTKNVVTSTGAASLTASSGAIDIDGWLVAEGKALLDAAGSVTVNNKIEAGDVEVQAHGDVVLQTVTSDADVVVHAYSGNVTFNDSVFANGTTNATLLVQTKGNVTVAEGKTLSVDNGSMTLDGHWSIGDKVKLIAQKATITDSAELTLKETTFDIGTGGLNVTAAKVLSMTTATIDSEGDVSLSAQSVTADSLTFNAQMGDIADVDFAVTATSGAVSMQGAQVDEVADFTVSATDGVNLSGLHTDNTTELQTSGAVNVRARAGEANFSGITAMTATAIDLQSGDKMTFVTAPKFVATGAMNVHSGGELAFAGAHVTANAVDLYAVGALTLEGATLTSVNAQNGFAKLNLRSGSDLNLLELNGELTTPLTLKAGSLKLIAGGIDDAVNVATDVQGKMQWGDRFVNFTTTAGHMTINATDVTVKGASADGTKSTLTANGGDLSIHGHQAVALGHKAELTGQNVTVTGGLTSFNVGLGAHVEATNGSIWIVSDSDATLGGSIFVKATATNTSGSPVPSNITIGAKGVLSVINDKFEITAEEGSVSVFGGYGMSILNDLTVISKEDTYLLTNLGNLSVGNNATVKAGTQSGLPKAEYGHILIHAGDKVTFGKEATILADNLEVTAGGDITFGDHPTLHGVTDGVVVKTVAGSIYMGEVLSVVSNATETLFEALAGDIVIEREAEVTTQQSSIKFVAGNDIIFKEHFIADGQGFVMQAGGDIQVYDDSTVQTEFDQLPNSTEFPETRIAAKGDITFGQNAHFMTTELLLDAGDWVTGTGGNITFGDGASMTTSVLGIALAAVGNITFGNDAHFGTMDAQVDGEVDLMAGGNITLGNAARIVARDIIRVVADGNISMGEEARIVDIAAQDNLVATPTVGMPSGATFTPYVSIFSEDGDVTIGSNATVWGSLVHINAGPQVSSASLTPNAVTIAESGGNVYIEHGARVNAGRFNDGEFIIEAAQDVNVGGALSLAAGSSIFNAQQGDITLEDGARIGTAGKMQMTAGEDITIGDGVTFVAFDRMADQTDDVRMDHAVNMTADGAILIGQDARMVTNANINIQAQNDITLASGARVAALDRANVDEAGNLEIISHTGTTSFNENAQIFAKDVLNISAQDDVLLTGQSGLYSGGDIALEATTGSVILNDTVRVGSGKFVDNEALTTETVTMTAGQNIAQQNMSGNGGMGIVTDNLEAIAGEEVSLGAMAKGLQGGNYFNDAKIEADGDVVVAVSQNATISINLNQGGQVDGALKLVGQNGEITVGHDLSATGSVTAVASGLAMQDVQSDSFVEVMMVNSDNANVTQALNVGNVVGQRVAISAQDASITAQSVTSTTGGVSVLRRSKSLTQAVDIGTIDSAHEVNVFNANGAIASDSVKAANTVYLMTGYNGTSPARDVVDSAIGKVAILDNAPQVGDYFIIERFDAWDAAESNVGFVPMIDIALQSLTQNTGIVDHDIKHAEDIRDLDHLKFFIHYEDGAVKPITPSIFNEWIVEMQTVEEDEEEIRI